MKKLKEAKELHEPVLLNEVLEALRVKEIARSKKACYIDATVGLGGHTREIVKAGARVLGIEADLYSLEIARERLKEACPTLESDDHFQGSFILTHGNFIEIEKIAKDNGFESVEGILFDLGISSFQLEGKNAGFSFQDPLAPLDMRIDPVSNKVKASDLLKVLNETQLIELFTVVLNTAKSRLVAKAIVRERAKKDIQTVGDFLYTIRGIFRPKRGQNVATLPFLALRIAVNSELENLKITLPAAFNLLNLGGKLVVICFHSGEDRIVKHFFITKEKKGVARLLTKKPIVPSYEEIQRNPRARSAKMRILEKI